MTVVILMVKAMTVAAVCFAAILGVAAVLSQGGGAGVDGANCHSALRHCLVTIF